MEGLGNENVKIFASRLLTKKKCGKRKTKNSTLNKFLEQRNEKFNTETMR